MFFWQLRLKTRLPEFLFPVLESRGWLTGIVCKKKLAKNETDRPLVKIEPF